MTSTTQSLCRMAAMALCAVMAAGLSGCIQAPRTEFAKPAVATSAPMDLGATATPEAGSPRVKAVAKGDKLAAPAPVATANPAAEPSDDALTKTQAAAVKAKPGPVPADSSGAAAFSDGGTNGIPDKMPSPVAKAVRDDGFPNINMPPGEPSGTLLTPEERAKVISELEALKNRQGVAPQKPAATPQKKPAKKCTDEQIAAGEAGCPAQPN